MARFVFCLKDGMRADRFLDPSPGLIFVAVFTKQYRGGNYFRVANMDPLCEFGNRVFLFSGGASRSSCGASCRSSMWFLGAPGTSSGAAVWGLNGGNEIALPGAGCRGEGIRVSGFLGIPKMELMSRSRGCFD